MKIKSFKCLTCHCRAEPFYEDVEHVQKLCTRKKSQCVIKKIVTDDLPHRKVTNLETNVEKAMNNPDAYEDFLPIHSAIFSDGKWNPCECKDCTYEFKKRLNRGWKWTIKGGIIDWERDNILVGWTAHGSLCNCQTCKFEREKYPETTEVNTTEDMEKEYPDVVEILITKQGKKEIVTRQ